MNDSATPVMKVEENITIFIVQHKHILFIIAYVVQNPYIVNVESDRLSRKYSLT